AVTDALHGDQGHARVPGEAVNAVAAVEETGALEGWRLCATGAMAKMLTEQAALGRKGRTSRGDDAVEVLGLAARRARFRRRRMARRPQEVPCRTRNPIAVRCWPGWPGPACHSAAPGPS